MPGNTSEMSIPSSTTRMRIDADIYSPLIVETRPYWQINACHLSRYPGYGAGDEEVILSTTLLISRQYFYRILRANPNTKDTGNERFRSRQNSSENLSS